MTEAAIAIEHLRVVRGGNIVLKDLDLNIPRGRITGLLGPSGCGKTTLMRSIVGVQVVSGGKVTVMGHPAGSSALRRNVGYVTQSPSVYEDLTVTSNLAYFQRLFGAPEPRVAEAIETVGLSGHSEKLVRNLSGGQRARVSLATALIARPELLVLDEPTVGLDPVLRAELWGTFRNLADQGATLLVSSHVMDEAERCDDLVLMREGEVLAQTTLNELLQRTGAPDVEAAFIQLIDKKEVSV
ncbi:MAG: ABC transporter ATP-binding protein [Dehalococcoidia bacterium]